MVEQEVWDCTGGVHVYTSKPTTRTEAPMTKPAGKEDATPIYGNGSVNAYTDRGTAQ